MADTLTLQSAYIIEDYLDPLLNYFVDKFIYGGSIVNGSNDNNNNNNTTNTKQATTLPDEDSDFFPGFINFEVRINNMTLFEML